jgi:hypothetical protein
VTDGSGLASRRGSVQPVQTAKDTFPGEIVTVGHAVVVPIPHSTNWLIPIVTEAVGSAVVSVPAAGDTVTRWFGSLVTDTDQVTAPPDACRVTRGPVNPGMTISVPPPGTTDSMPVGGMPVGAGRGAGGGVGLAVVGAGPELGGGGVGLGVVGTGDGRDGGGAALAVVGTGDGRGGGGAALAVVGVVDGLRVAGTGTGPAVMSAGGRPAVACARAGDAGTTVGAALGAGLGAGFDAVLRGAGPAAGETGGGPDAGGFGLADGVECSLLPVSAKATAATATAITTATATAACPFGDRSTFVRPAA